MSNAESIPVEGQAGDSGVVPESQVTPLADEGTDDFTTAFDKAWENGQGDKAETPITPPVETKAKETPATKESASSADAKQTPTDAVGDEVAPQDWSDAEKQAYGKLPKDAQTQVMRLYKSFQRGYTQKSQLLSEKAKFADQLEPILAPFAGDLAREGINAAQGIERLVQLHGFARTNPVEYAKWFMQQAGIKPDQLGITQPAGTQADPAFVDPEIAALKQQINQLTGWRDQQQRSAIVSHQNHVAQTLAGFVNARSETGEPKHPHYEQVKVQIAALLRTDPNMSLEEAYDQAVWASPGLRQGLVEAERTRVLDAERKSAAAAVAKARAAGPHVRGAPPSTASNVKSGDFDDHFAAAWDRLQAG